MLKCSSRVSIPHNFFSSWKVSLKVFNFFPFFSMFTTTEQSTLLSSRCASLQWFGIGEKSFPFKPITSLEFGSFSKNVFIPLFILIWERQRFSRNRASEREREMKILRHVCLYFGLSDEQSFETLRRFTFLCSGMWRMVARFITKYGNVEQNQKNILWGKTCENFVRAEAVSERKATSERIFGKTFLSWNFPVHIIFSYSSSSLFIVTIQLRVTKNTFRLSKRLPSKTCRRH